MGLFDSILGTKTSAATDAATNNANANAVSWQQAAARALNSGATNATTALNTGLTNATGALTSNYGAGVGALTNYGGQAQGTLANGVNNAVGTIQGSNGAYAPYAASGGAANGMLDNALGLNGTAGNATATSAFQAAPSYQYTVDQATGAAQRAAAAGGMNASGNTLAAVSQLAGNLAGQGYQTWLSNLQGQGAQGLTAAQGVSGNNQAAGSAQLTGGTTGATLQQSTGQNIGMLDAALGSALGGANTGTATNLANVQTGLGNALSNNDMTTGQLISNAEIGAGKADDSAANANSGILSGMLGSFLSPVTGAASKSFGNVLSGATGGFL